MCDCDGRAELTCVSCHLSAVGKRERGIWERYGYVRVRLGPTMIAELYALCMRAAGRSGLSARKTGQARADRKTSTNYKILLYHSTYSHHHHPRSPSRSHPTRHVRIRNRHPTTHARSRRRRWSTPRYLQRSKQPINQSLSSLGKARQSTERR